ncbi:unnamed protein product, partial [Didymodactylos carnosus]
MRFSVPFVKHFLFMRGKVFSTVLTPCSPSPFNIRAYDEKPTNNFKVNFIRTNSDNEPLFVKRRNITDINKLNVQILHDKSLVSKQKRLILSYDDDFLSNQADVKEHLRYLPDPFRLVKALEYGLPMSCSLHVVVDYNFYKHIGGENEIVTLREI